MESEKLLSSSSAPSPTRNSVDFETRGSVKASAPPGRRMAAVPVHGAPVLRLLAIAQIMSKQTSVSAFFYYMRLSLCLYACLSASCSACVHLWVFSPCVPHCFLLLVCAFLLLDLRKCSSIFRSACMHFSCCVVVPLFLCMCMSSYIWLYVSVCMYLADWKPLLTSFCIVKVHTQMLVVNWGAACN